MRNQNFNHSAKRNSVLGRVIFAGVLAFISTSIMDVKHVRAQEGAVATIDGKPVTQRELGLANTDLKQQYAKVPEEMRDAAILNALIDIKVLAKAAEKDGLADSDAFKARIEFLRARTLHNAYFQQMAVSEVKDEDVKARYEKEIASKPAEKQISARHILVKTEDEAKALIAELDGGADFAELAKAKSTGPSGANGGTLGYFGKGQMVPEFEVSAFALEKGDYTKAAVKTQFGWHVILKEDERDTPAPEFEQVQGQIRQLLLREKYIELVKKARESFKVEILDEELKTKMNLLMAQ